MALSVLHTTNLQRTPRELFYNQLDFSNVLLEQLNADRPTPTSQILTQQVDRPASTTNQCSRYLADIVRSCRDRHAIKKLVDLPDATAIGPPEPQAVEHL